MADLMNYASTAIAAVLALHTAAIAVVNLTPTPKDNAVVEVVYKVVEVLAGVITPAAKDAKPKADKAEAPAKESGR